MSKLSAQQVQEILNKKYEGESVTILAKEYCVTKMVIYYHIKTKGIYYVPHPICYTDYVKNTIFRLQKKALDCPSERKRLESEIRRLKFSLGIRRDRCSQDPFVLQ